MNVETTEYTIEINASGDSEPSDNCIRVRQARRACQKDNPTNTSVIRSRFGAFQNQYGTGYDRRKMYLPELMYNNVERYGFSPFSDNSKSTEAIQKILVSGIVKGDSASSITKAIRDGNEKHNWAATKFSSRPILDNPSTNSDPLAPIAATFARGSSRTDNDLTSQITNCFITLYLLAKVDILPSDTQILLQAFAAFEVDRVLLERSPRSFRFFFRYPENDLSTYQ